MILIKKSPTADTRTCDWSKVTKEQLEESSKLHIQDVREGLAYFQHELEKRRPNHDFDKLTDLDGFHADFATGFKSTKWYDNHLKVNRHHINYPAGVRDDVNLVDVLEHVVDCITAGMARSGSLFPVELSNELLQKALKNTVDQFTAQIKVVDE